MGGMERGGPRGGMGGCEGEAVWSVTGDGNKKTEAK